VLILPINCVDSECSAENLPTTFETACTAPFMAIPKIKSSLVVAASPEIIAVTWAVFCFVPVYLIDASSAAPLCVTSVKKKADVAGFKCTIFASPDDAIVIVVPAPRYATCAIGI